MIRLDGISATSPGHAGASYRLLNAITLSIPAGDWVTVVGPNGSGKTTLLKALAGVQPLASGRVSYEGYEGASPVFSLMLQDPDNQFVADSVRTELVLSAGRREGARNRTKPGPAVSAAERIRGAVDRFSLGGILDRNPHDLSGGEKQRLAMAGVWLSQPDVLLLDEPVSFMDGGARRECVASVRELNAEGVTVVWVSPGGDELVHAATVVYMEKGSVLFAGSLDRFFAFAREHDRVNALPGIFQLGKKLIEITKGPDAGNGHAGDSPAPEAPEAPGTPEAPGMPEAPKAPPGGEMLALRDVSFSYGKGMFAFERLNAALAPGECVGVTGPSGSGKTTLLELAGGVLKPASGEVSAGRSPRDRADLRDGEKRADIFYLFQSPERMFFKETVYEEIAYGLEHLGVSSGDLVPRASRALGSVGLDPDAFLSRSPFRLSFGEMRRLALAIAIAVKPRLLLADEPSSCLDADGTAVLLSALRELRREGTGVLAASHDVDFLAGLCDRIIFLGRGAAARVLALPGAALPRAAEWPGREKPLVLELQDVLSAGGKRFEPRPVSPGGFIRALIDDARIERDGES